MAHAQNMAEGKSVTKRKENSNLVRNVFLLFICFRTFRFITVILFAGLFYLENRECYFRSVFVLWLLTLHFIDSVGTNQFE